MFRRTFVILLIGALQITLVGLRPVSVLAKDESASVEMIRSDVAKLGVGKNAKVKVKLRDGSKLEGYVSETTKESFTVVHFKTGSSTTIPFPDVSQVSRPGKGLSTLTKVLIGAGIAGGAIIGWKILKPAVCDGGAQTRGPC